MSFGPITWVENETGTGALTCTKAAPGAGKRLILQGATISFQAAPTAALRAELRGDITPGGTGNDSDVIEYIDLPANAMAPVHLTFRNGLRLKINGACTLYLPAAGVEASVTLRGTITRS